MLLLYKTEFNLPCSSISFKTNIDDILGGAPKVLRIQVQGHKHTAAAVIALIRTTPPSKFECSIVIDLCIFL